MATASTKIIQKLQAVAQAAIDRQNYEKALAAIAAGGSILYTHNQYYTDQVFEQQLLSVEAGALSGIPKHFAPEQNTVLFYDGFGLDTRGLALIFVKALARLGYRVVYLVPATALGTQPNIQKAVEGLDVTWCGIDTRRSHLAWAQQICRAFVEYKPANAFFYTRPDDVSAAIAFGHFAGTVTRYQIDLTDHAFWLGIHAFDYCMALRDVGAKIACHYRGVPKEKLVLLPYYPTIDYSAPFQGFPFDAEGRQVMFSGGALYKTLGDGDNTYYKMAGALLEKHPDLVFLYAGTGDDSQLKLLAQRFPDRVYHIAERSDLYQVIRHSVLYLNTYPMFGGLMMHYAAAAGRLPLTLKHGHDADGLLLDQPKLGIEYDTPDALVEDADRLLRDPAYRQQREARLEGCVLTEQRFEENLKYLLTERRTEFTCGLEPIDTRQFRAEYDRRFRCHPTVREAVASKRKRALLFTFPLLFLEAFCIRVFRRMKRTFLRGA